MKRTLHSMLCLMAVLLITCLPFTGYAEMQDAQGRFLYLDIPFNDITAEDVSRIVMENKGAAFEISDKAWSGTAYGIEDFGYEWNMQLDFNENYIGVNRILLSSAQSARVDKEGFYDRLQTDLQQFIDVENQLTTLYGEPDAQYFFIIGKQDGKPHKVMFQSGLWDLEQMMNVCDEYQWFWAYSTWNNVILKARVDWEKPNINGDYLSRIMLYYYPEIDKTEGVFAVPIEQYPLTSND